MDLVVFLIVVEEQRLSLDLSWRVEYQCGLISSKWHWNRHRSIVIPPPRDFRLIRAFSGLSWRKGYGLRTLLLGAGQLVVPFPPKADRNTRDLAAKILSAEILPPNLRGFQPQKGESKTTIRDKSNVGLFASIGDETMAAVWWPSWIFYFLVLKIVLTFS